MNTVVAFDQRGCGRSTPSAADDRSSLPSNTTQALIEDIEARREQVEIDGWIVVRLS